MDFETRSECDLPAVGGRAYVRDESTELLVACAIDSRLDPSPIYVWSPWLALGVPIRGWEVGGADLQAMGFDPASLLWLPPAADLPVPLARAAAGGVPLVAHNAAVFDELAWDALGYPPATFLDSMPRARRRGLPGGLESIGELTTGVGKDPIGSRVQKLLSEPIRKGPMRGRFVPPDAARLSAVARYCARDVLLLAAAWADERLGDPHPDDRALAVHEVVNARGILVDVAAAQRLRRESELQQAEAIRAAEEATGGEVTAPVLSSPLRLQRWLISKKIMAPDATRSTMERILAAPDVSPAVRAAVVARLAVARVTDDKIDGLLRHACPDNRLRDMYSYWGAHTGRFTAHGVQTQNFKTPRVAIKEDVYDEPSLAPAVAVEQDITVQEMFGSMLRGLFIAPEGLMLGVIDYSSVEARKLLWLARDEAGLAEIEEDDREAEDAAREGRKPRSDSYRRLAARIYSCEVGEVTKDQRQAGKVGVLACGYQGGPDALTRMAEKAKIDLAAAGVTAEQVVEAWRDANPLVAGRARGTWTTPDGRPIVTRKGGIWRACHALAGEIARGERSEGEASRCRWYRDGRHLVIELPSRRPLVYREVRWEKAPTKWGGEADAVTYQSPRGYRTATYGGKLVENIDQASCRDLMVAAMAELEERGIPVVMHTHDEIVFEHETQEQFDEAMRVVSSPPKWAAGLPLRGEGGRGRRYRKP